LKGNIMAKEKELEAWEVKKINAKKRAKKEKKK
jgi:hypothetical protein